VPQVVVVAEEQPRARGGRLATRREVLCGQRPDRLAQVLVLRELAALPKAYKIEWQPRRLQQLVCRGRQHLVHCMPRNVERLGRFALRLD
jgi:hypothetical protein